MPYQYPNPPDALPEIVVPHAIPQDERLWSRRPRTWFRPLCLNASQGYWMNLLRVRKSGVLSRHRHPQAVHGFVLGDAGATWNTTGRPWKAAMFEPPGETHACTCPRTSRK